MAVQVIQPEKKKSEQDMLMDMGKEMAMSYGKQKLAGMMGAPKAEPEAPEADIGIEKSTKGLDLSTPRDRRKKELMQGPGSGYGGTSIA